MALHIALIQPEIPPNTGNIARLCAATDTSLHLIEPLGFSIEDADLKRAGLDYWEHVDLWRHRNWFAFRDAMARSRCLYFSANAARPYWEAPYRPNSCLVFGNETEDAGPDSGEASGRVLYHSDVLGPRPKSQPRHGRRHRPL